MHRLKLQCGIFRNTTFVLHTMVMCSVLVVFYDDGLKNRKIAPVVLTESFNSFMHEKFMPVNRTLSRNVDRDHKPQNTPSYAVYIFHFNNF